MQSFKYFISQCNLAGVINDAFNAVYSIIKSCYYPTFPLTRWKTNKLHEWQMVSVPYSQNDKLYRDIANYFNKYFANFGPNLAKNIPNSSSTYAAFLNNLCDNNIFLQPVTENEMLVIIKALSSWSPGFDDICAKPIKYISEIIAIPLRYICQLSLIEGCFPNEPKIAKTIHLYKNGEKSQFDHYRQMSLLPLFSHV